MPERMFEFEKTTFGSKSKAEIIDPCSDCGHSVKLHAHEALLREFPEKSVCPKSGCNCRRVKENRQS